MDALTDQGSNRTGHPVQFDAAEIDGNTALDACQRVAYDALALKRMFLLLYLPLDEQTHGGSPIQLYWQFERDTVPLISTRVPSTVRGRLPTTDSTPCPWAGRRGSRRR